MCAQSPDFPARKFLEGAQERRGSSPPPPPLQALRTAPAAALNGTEVPNCHRTLQHGSQMSHWILHGIHLPWDHLCPPSSKAGPPLSQTTYNLVYLPAVSQHLFSLLLTTQPAAQCWGFTRLPGAKPCSVLAVHLCSFQFYPHNNLLIALVFLYQTRRVQRACCRNSSHSACTALGSCPPSPALGHATDFDNKEKTGIKCMVVNYTCTSGLAFLPTLKAFPPCVKKLRSTSQGLNSHREPDETANRRRPLRQPQA